MCPLIKATKAKSFDVIVQIEASLHLIMLAPVQKMSRHMHRQDVVQKTLVVFTQFPHVLHFLLGLQTPQEVQSGSGLPLEGKG